MHCLLAAFSRAAMDRKTCTYKAYKQRILVNNLADFLLFFRPNDILAFWSSKNFSVPSVPVKTQLSPLKIFPSEKLFIFKQKEEEKI